MELVRSYRYSFQSGKYWENRIERYDLGISRAQPRPLTPCMTPVRHCPPRHRLSPWAQNSRSPSWSNPCRRRQASSPLRIWNTNMNAVHRSAVNAPIHCQALSYDRRILTSLSDSTLCPIGNLACAVLIRHKTLSEGEVTVCLLP